MGEKVTLKDKGISHAGDPTTVFNYLAFAFYMYWEDTDYYVGSACWMSDISVYISDKSFIGVSEPQVNDVVCYFSSGGIINAGIIREVYANEASNLSSNDPFVKQLSKYRVLSMWGAFGLYEHRGDLCPVINKYASEYVTASPTSNVLFLRRHTHNFKVVKGSDSGDGTHTAICSECGETKQERHNYTYSKKSTDTHMATCECGQKELQKHTWIIYSNPMYPSYNTYVQCKHCLFIKQLGDDEIVPVLPFKKPVDELLDLNLYLS